MVCDAVSRRAAHMCASGVAAIATKIHANRPDEYLDLTCGVDGSVYKKHPTFSKFLQVTCITLYHQNVPSDKSQGCR